MIGLSNGVRFVRHHVFVDNLGMKDCSRDGVARELSEVTSIFEKVGVAVHGLEMSRGEMKGSGVDLDSHFLRTAVTRERYWRVHGAPSHLLSRYAALVRRQVLSVFHCVYRFIVAERGKQGAQWPSVVEELRVLRGLMPFLSSDWWLRWDLLVSASDASSNGYGCRPRCGRMKCQAGRCESETGSAIAELPLLRSVSDQTFELLNQIRVFASYVFARKYTPTVRRVPSEFDNSDEPSRRCDPFPSVFSFVDA